jgi:hypothetical protein
MDRPVQGQFFVGDAEKIGSDIRACERLGVSYLAFNLSGQTLEESINNMEEFGKKIMPLSRS